MIEYASDIKCLHAVYTGGMYICMHACPIDVNLNT